MSDGYAPGVGYPDWERVTTLVSDPLVRDGQVPAARAKDYGPFYVGAFPTLRVVCEPSGTGNGSYNVICTWCRDQTLTEILGSFSWYGDDQIGVMDATTNIGPWLFVQVTNNTTDPNLNLQTTVVATTADVPDSRRAQGLMLADNDALAVGAASSVVVPFAWVTSGACKVYGYSTASDWSVTVNELIAGARTGDLARTSDTSPMAGIPMGLYLPAQPCGLTVANAGASPITVAVSAVVP